jgi:hypothetical protein
LIFKFTFYLKLPTVTISATDINITYIYIFIHGFTIISQETKNVVVEAGAHLATPVDTPMRYTNIFISFLCLPLNRKKQKIQL